MTVIYFNLYCYDQQFIASYLNGVLSIINKLPLQYVIRLAANPSIPAHEVAFPPKYVALYEQKPKTIKSFGIRTSPLLESTLYWKTFYTKYSSLVCERTRNTFRFTVWEKLNQIHIY